MVIYLEDLAPHRVRVSDLVDGPATDRWPAMAGSVPAEPCASRGGTDDEPGRAGERSDRADEAASLRHKGSGCPFLSGHRMFLVGLLTVGFLPNSTGHLSALG